MFQAGILALGILTYNAKIYVVMPGLVTRDIFDQDNRCVYV